MGDLIDMTDMLPHEALYVACMACAHDWVAVVSKRVLWPLECPDCGGMHGEKIAYHDVEWFRRFMDGPDQQKRGMVLINAKRVAQKEQE